MFQKHTKLFIWLVSNFGGIVKNTFSLIKECQQQCKSMYNIVYV